MLRSILGLAAGALQRLRSALTAGSASASLCPPCNRRRWVGACGHSSVPDAKGHFHPWALWPGVPKALGCSGAVGWPRCLAVTQEGVC